MTCTFNSQFLFLCYLILGQMISSIDSLKFFINKPELCKQKMHLFTTPFLPSDNYPNKTLSECGSMIPHYSFLSTCSSAPAIYSVLGTRRHATHGGHAGGYQGLITQQVSPGWYSSLEILTSAGPMHNWGSVRKRSNKTPNNVPVAQEL